MLEDEAVKGIIEHLNDDHADAVLLYVRAFAGHDAATSAYIVNFDEKGMGIAFIENDKEASCRIDFEKPLAHAGEARRVLVDMVGKARKRLGEPTPNEGHG
ncbi:DUF2470 domain-containing protein [Thioalkalivibrio sp. HK1]|uniref:DUF2470 domain-containing protein n=1 Tax=Thioalkalivibrio sp. HK1 TaxID=1469245 RepID=UPI000470C042|nr:DUF2470 domain-containing protein [Thioalkalivibrio sp. HK1]